MECLQVGYRTDDPLLVEAQWLNFNKDRCKTVKILERNRPKGFLKSICACVPSKGWKDNTVCKAHLFYGRVTEEGVAHTEVKSVILEHTCTDSDPGWKRQYKTETIENAYDSLKLFVPPAKRHGGGAKQYCLTAQTGGHKISRSQAYQALQRKKSDTPEICVGQYFLLPGLIDTWRREDRHGTYKLETTAVTWSQKRQFKRYYIAMSCMKRAWCHNVVKIVVSDGTFTTGGYFKHTLLLAVSFDGNNNIIVLAVAAVYVEDGDSWLWFGRNLHNDFAGFVTMTLRALKSFRPMPIRES